MAEETAWFSEDTAQGVAKLKEGIPSPGRNKCWDSLQTQHKLVTQIIQTCCHPDPFGRPSAAYVAEMLLEELLDIEDEIALQEASQ